MTIMKKAPTITRVLAAAFLVAQLPACAAVNPKTLTRERARSAIQNSKSFSSPAVIALESSDNVLVEATSLDEPEPTAKAIQYFYEDRPALALLAHLGLISARATVRKRPEPNFRGKPFPWHFSVTTELTAEGKRMAAEAGATGKPEGIPTFRREVIEVTALTAPQGGRAQADFTWKRVPTRVGEALDPGRDAHKALPVELQQALGKRRGMPGTAFYSGGLLQSYDEVRKGIADLQLFDDGWRVVALR
jgi:hypothetical protein